MRLVACRPGPAATPRADFLPDRPVKFRQAESVGLAYPRVAIFAMPLTKNATDFTRRSYRCSYLCARTGPMADRLDRFTLLSGGVGKARAKVVGLAVTAVTFHGSGKCQLRHSSFTGVSKSLPLVYRFVIAAGMGSPEPPRNR